MWHVSVSVNIRQRYLVLRVYAETLQIELEHAPPKYYSDIVMAESDAEDVKLDYPDFNQTFPVWAYAQKAFIYPRHTV